MVRHRARTHGERSMIDGDEAIRTAPEEDLDVFRLMIESIGEYAIILLDPGGHIRTWNASAQAINGYAPDEVIGKHFSVLHAPERIAHGDPETELKVAATEGRWEDEGWQVHKSGARFWAHFAITAIWDEKRSLVGFAIVIHDLNERKRAEEERQNLLTLEHEARRRAELALEQLRAIQTVTEAALSHLHVDDLLDDLLGKIVEILSVDTVAVLLLDESKTGVVARAAKGLEEEVRRGVRVPLGRGFAGRIAKEARPIILDDVARADIVNPLLREKGLKSALGVPLIVQGQVLGVLHVGSLSPRRFVEQDTQFLQIVGDRVALAINQANLFEQALAARQDANIAEATLRARDEFLSVAAHELKTPITSLRLATQMMFRRFRRDEMPGATQFIHALETIDRQSFRLSRLVTQLLETTRLQSGELPIHTSLADFIEVVAGVVEQLQNQTSRHVLKLTTPESMVFVFDTLRMEQVVTNLIDNAIKFSPDGGQIDVQVSRAPDVIRLEVRDRGIGVPVRHRARLFERFHQAHGHEYRSGMGLGLFISREIVRAHEGQIWAEFPDEGGLCVIVELPNAAEKIPELAG